jgi:hypothetical protein
VRRRPARSIEEEPVGYLVVIVIAGAVVGFATWFLATANQRDRGTGAPGPVDVTDRTVTPPEPGSPAARTIDAPGSQRDRSSKGKP